MYEEFLEKSLNSKRQAVDDTFIAKYADLSYPELNTLWQEVGLGSFCNGLFKLINPSDYQDVINSCFEKEDDQSFLPFMCTAFGDLFAYVKNPRLNNYVVYLNVRYGTYLILPANLRAIFNYNPQIQISAESETKRSIFRKRDKTKRSKKESAQHSKSRNKSFVMTSVSAL